jgi:hypothetical protein
MNSATTMHEQIALDSKVRFAARKAGWKAILAERN